MKYKNLAIYGGTSEITIELIKLYIEECNKIFIFTRNLNDVKETISTDNFFRPEQISKIEILECNLLNIKKIIDVINEKIFDLSGLIWVAGYTGNSIDEYNDYNLAKNNLEINFINPVIIINEFSKKIIKNQNSFLAVITSVAGLRGRKTQLFYSSAKSGLITYLSGLRQKLSIDNILVCTVIPGYMNTKPFREGNWKSPSFLISSSKKSAKLIKDGINKKKEIIYINFYWKIIMILISIIPEKIFKKLNF